MLILIRDDIYYFDVVITTRLYDQQLVLANKTYDSKA